MRNIILILLVIFVVYTKAGTVPFGSTSFYAEANYTNTDFGPGAQFPISIWYTSNGSGGIKRMRIDYFNPTNYVKFMSVLYNYDTKDYYEVCGTSCKRATYNTAQAIFQGSAGTISTCAVPEWKGPRACSNTNCATIVINQASGTYSLSYDDNDSNPQTLCLVRFQQTGGPEWHIRSFLTTGWTTAQDPVSATNYNSVIASVTCPQPTCFAELDIALVIDESGSIAKASAWNDVQGFVKNLITSFSMAPNGIRVGLVYFSGQNYDLQCKTFNKKGDCTDQSAYLYCGKNYTSAGTSVDCSVNGNRDIYDDKVEGCHKCGGLWNTITTNGVISDKSGLLKNVDAHIQAEGFTCISCGLHQGMNILNVSPKQNVGKVIILMTDGAQNRVMDGLIPNAKYAYDQKISVIAVGVGAYKLSDLQQITSNDKIFTTQYFTQLNNLISSIITPLCQDLPTIQSCDACSGICSCSTKCECPVCNDYNACTTDSCTQGKCVTVPKTCDDSKYCTQDLCDTTSGCYNPPIDNPPNQQNSYCITYICDNDQRKFNPTYTDCGTNANKCIIQYCNTTVGNTNNLVGSCQQIDKSTFPVGTSMTYKDPLGNVISVSGCGRPSSALPCDIYGCFANNGSCSFSSVCGCRQNSDCFDGNGCTTDICNTTTYQCQFTPRDCYSELSNGGCKTSQTLSSVNSTTGGRYYNGQISFDGSTTLPSSGTFRTCDDLACYGGVRNSYVCTPTSSSSSVCTRSVQQCTSGACLDSACRTLTSWTVIGTNTILDTDCKLNFTRTCNDNDLCTSDNCNPNFSASSCQQATAGCQATVATGRCQAPSNASLCVDGNKCTSDRCVSPTGCRFDTLPLPPSNICFNRGCTPNGGNFSTVKTDACPQTDKCIINYCDSTAGGSCQFLDKNSIPLGQTRTYVDVYGATQTVSGCQSADVGCTKFGCDSATGLCFTNSSGCTCTSLNDPACNDFNGCTQDSCILPAGKCQNKPYDCWSISSNNGCSVNQGGLTASNATGLAAYYQNNTGVAGGVFNPITGNCDALACFAGQQSQYTCQNVSSSSYQCIRSVAPCTKGGCLDTICTSGTTWTNGQLDTDCSSSIAPTCPSDACGINVCDSASTWPSPNRCTYISNATLCDDFNECTENQCFPQAGGCNYDKLKTQPIPNTFCINYQCDPQKGFQPVDVGKIRCPSQGKCVLSYCNTTVGQTDVSGTNYTGSCQPIKKRELKIDQTLVYTDSDGITYTVTGCGKPTSEQLACKDFDCSDSNGQCTTSLSTCICINDAGCEDGSGCTIDKCDLVNNKCNRTLIDCFNVLSNGNCNVNVPFTASAQPGVTLYNGTVPANNVYTQFDANGDVPRGVNRSCAELGCYNGQPSTYSCFSITEGSFTCQRQSLNCTRGGCQDNICRTLGTWNNSQIQSDCNIVNKPVCVHKDACFNDYCNATWKVGDAPSTRCIHEPINITKYCDDGNFCTLDLCDSQSTSGQICIHNVYDDFHLRNKICNVSDPSTLICKTIKCTVNKCIYTPLSCKAGTPCFFYTCNASTNGTCKEYPTGIYKVDKCGKCGGDGRGCLAIVPSNPKKTSIIVALAVGLTLGLLFGLGIIIVVTRTSYNAYAALAHEIQGSVTTSSVHQTNDDNFVASN